MWHNNKTNYAFQSWVIVDGFAYGFIRDRQESIGCLDLRSGKMRWSEDLGDWGSLIAADGKLIILKGNGELTIAAAEPNGFTVISQTRIFRLKSWRSYPDGRPNTCWTAPVLANGNIYTRTTHGDLACVDVQG